MYIKSWTWIIKINVNYILKVYLQFYISNYTLMSLLN